jgi:hypothetical protein
MEQQERYADATWTMLRKAEAKSAANGRDTATPIAAMGEGADMLGTAEPRSEPRFEPKSESTSESSSELAPAGGTDARQ